MHWHPALVHFPIALLFTAAAGYVAAAVKPDRWWAEAALWLHIGGVTGLFLAIISGSAAEPPSPDNPLLKQTLQLHELMGWANLWLFGLLMLWPFLRKNNMKPAERWTFASVMVLSLAVLTYSAYLGGKLVFEFGVGVIVPN